MDKELSRIAKARLECPFLSTKEAAHYLGLATRTLEKMRVTGHGPNFRKHGRYVRYHLDELDRWSEGRQHRSTSDAGER